MSESRPAVALLFDDAELGGQLRQALQEQGVRIVHEGAVAGFDAGLCQRLDPDVLVVNLDDEDDASFDRLMEMVDGERPRLVLNDARASRALAGWDRARWARHLAVKVLAEGDVDPPRPADALAVVAIPAVPAAAAVAVTDPLGSVDPDESVAPVADAPARDASMADDLEAELAALLAAEEASPAAAAAPDMAQHAVSLHDDDFGLSLAEEASPAAAVAPAVAQHAASLHDEDFGLSLAGEASPAAAVAPAMAQHAVSLHGEDFGLALAEDEPTAATLSAAVAAAPAAPAGWSLVDHDEPLAPGQGQAAAAEFGIEKLSAADFLAPDVEPAADDVQPTMSLELMSVEEAVAPQPREASEMLLDDLGGVPSRVLLLGAAADGLDAVCDFLAALPASARYTVLLTQHFGEQPVEAVLQLLSIHSSLPVHLAEHGDRTRGGEVLLAPASGQVQLRRDGSIEIKSHDGAPSIDASFTMAAGIFGRDALAIVFSGRSTDAVAGAQAIHDRGGQVWTEASHGEYFADMVSGIAAERLVSFSGTLQELAAHLIEVHP